MLTVPVKLDLDAGAAEAALKKFEQGARDALTEIVEFNGKKVNIDFRFSSSGDPIVKELSDTEAALKKTTSAYDKLTGGQQKSIGRTKKIIQQFKAERDALAANSQEYKNAANTVKKFEGELRTLQGVQVGSINDLKQQRSALVDLKDSVKKNSPEFKKLTTQIKQLDDRLSQTTPKVKSFFSVLGKIAVAQAAFSAVTGAIRSAANALGAFTARTKEIEAFNLAIKNVGFSQAETNRIFQQAETTANRLGAPLQQVEQSYKRMIPALKAVGTSAGDSDKFIAAISARSQTLGLNTEQSGRLLEAFAQVLSKGKLQAEELNQQISELDGAFRTQFADALGVTSAALNELISDSKITADVFVKTVNKMQNGVDELAKRVKNGTATIQQLQNAASNVETKNLEDIAKSIEPAIKAFLKIRLAVADFIKEFKKTETFDFLATTFNQIAKSAQTLVAATLALVLAFSQLLAPITGLLDFILSIDAGFGGLIGVLTLVAAGFLAVKVAMVGLLLIAKLKALITATSVAFKGLFLSAKQAAVGMNTATFSTKKLLVGLRALKSAVPFLAIAAGVGLIVNAFRASAKAAAEVEKQYASSFDILREGLKSSSDEAKKAPVNIKKATKSVEEASNAARVGAGVYYSLGVIFAGVGVAAAAVATGGLALLAIGLTTAAAAGTAAAIATKELQKSEKGRALIENTKKYNKQLSVAEKRAQDLGAAIGTTDFSGFASGSKELEELNGVYRTTAKSVKERISQNKDLINSERLKDKPMKAFINHLEAQNVLLEEDIRLANSSLKALQDEIAARLRSGDANEMARASAEALAAAQKQVNEGIESDKIKAQTEAIEDYGKKANAASLIAAAGIAAEVVASEQRTKNAENTLKVLAQRGKLNEEEIALQRKLTNVVATEAQKRAQLEMNARAAVIEAFKAGIAEVEGQVDVIAQSASNLKSSFDGVTGSLVTGLQAANGLINEIASRELEGLEVGSTKRKQIIASQLKAQNLSNQIENKIAELRLKTQNKIEVSQAKIEQARLRTAAAVAKAEGKTALSSALTQGANEQNLIIQALNQQLTIGSELLQIEKLTGDQKLINQGLEEGIAGSAAGVAQKLGLQVVTLGEATERQRDLLGLADNYGKALSNAAVQSQATAEALQKTSLKEGADQAFEMFDALDNASGAAEGLNAAMDAATGNIDDAASSAQRMEGFLKSAVGEAGRLQRIVLSGAPARALGGPVSSGKQYTVNDGGGREGFLSNSGKFSMLPAARNMKWTAPTSGTVIPASLVNDFISASASQKIQSASAGVKPRQNLSANTTSEAVSGNLVKQMTAALTGSGGNQRITNNVTIQSQQPVTDASKIMTNVARMRLRNGRRI